MKSLWGALFTCLLWWPLSVSGATPARSEEGFRLVAFPAEVMATIARDESWKTCGKYFAAAESTEGKIIHFSYQMIPRKIVFAFTLPERLVVSVSERAATPLLTLRGQPGNAFFHLQMRGADYRSALPCLSQGAGI